MLICYCCVVRPVQHTQDRSFTCDFNKMPLIQSVETLSNLETLLIKWLFFYFEFLDFKNQLPEEFSCGKDKYLL